MTIAPVPYYTSPDGLWRARGREPLFPAGDDAYIPGWGFPTWRDEFDGPSIDTTKWTIRSASTHGNLDYDWGVITAENAFITGDGHLCLRTSRRDSPVTSAGHIRWWNTAYLDSIGKFTAQYGLWVFRAKIPTLANVSQGVWPALWLRNNPAQGEIDVMESWGDPTRSRARAIQHTETSAWAIHERTDGTGETYNVTHEHRAFGWPSGPGNTAQDFHTWAVEYTPQHLRFYFDDIMTADIRPAQGGNPSMDYHPRATPAHQAKNTSFVWGPTFTTAPWHIRLQAQMGDRYWSLDGGPDNIGDGSLSADMPADFLIDYVRYYPLPE